MGESEELLDILDDEGRTIGQKLRAEVHRDHDRHGLVFVWAAWQSAGRRFMILQRRGKEGDPFAGQVDALAGGHIEAGETTLAAARRELAEEVGLDVKPQDLVHLGSNRKDRPVGACRRVFQHLFLLRNPLEMEAVRFTAEVDGVFLVDPQGFSELVHGERDWTPAAIRDRDGTESVLLDRGFIDYPEAILDTFRWSMSSIDECLYRAV